MIHPLGIKNIHPCWLRNFTKKCQHHRDATVMKSQVITTVSRIQPLENMGILQLLYRYLSLE